MTFRVSALLLFLAALAAPRVASACSVSVTPLAFGPYDVFDRSPSDSIAKVHWTCPAGATSFRISFAGNGRDRRLTNGDSTLRYGLYLDAARTRPWGDGADGTETYIVAVPERGGTGTVTVFGRIHARQKATAGVYSDTLTVTIEM